MSQAVISTGELQRKRLIQLLKALAVQRLPESVTYAELANAAGMPWQSVRRLLGSRKQFAVLVNETWPDETLFPPDNREKILASAARVFAAHGFHAASLDKVAADAGLTKGAVYWHFASKNDLFFALLDKHCQAQAEDLPRQFENSLPDQVQLPGLQQLIWNVLQQLSNNPNQLPLLLLEFFGQTRSPDIREKLGEQYRQSYARTAALITGGLAEPDVQKHAEMQALFWHALIDGLMMAMQANPTHYNWAEMVPEMIAWLWKGVESCPLQQEQQPSIKQASDAGGTS
ncbi:TetR/AcrR family transcriptional regulator [Leeia oryzae]|uniref:TetR/AcrR family transcriptional regulator n=1 Tax=Leeia oryzae TaxID=356662 RepID=UPI00039E2AE3|nr:TetR/AcrR family transcriptional regulator [Leeia oryzae]